MSLHSTMDDNLIVNDKMLQPYQIDLFKETTLDIIIGRHIICIYTMHKYIYG